jgi:3-isopropylmalate/(R)-2-methylmalate dehydratase small subunit
MQAFTKLNATAAPLPLMNVDTDMIIPKQFLRTIKRSGLGKNLFNDMRYHEDGTPNKDFILNKDEYKDAQILISGENFGCGSSREHAPWALLDFGIRCIIAPSYADIFFNNCFKNGILPIALKEDSVNALSKEVSDNPNSKIEIDLDAQTISSEQGLNFNFEIEAFRKHCLLNGLDDIGLTLEKEAKITEYENDNQNKSPWLWKEG